jgi:ankyrin repeat protein
MSALTFPFNFWKLLPGGGWILMVRTMRLNRPLYEAARYGEIKAIKLTISAVADIDDNSSSGRTAVSAAGT